MSEKKFLGFGELLERALTWFNIGEKSVPKNDLLTELSEEDLVAELAMPGKLPEHYLSKPSA